MTIKKPSNTIGVDIIEIKRIKGAVLHWQYAFLKRIYTEAELKYCGERYPSLAARFAAKEAVMKSLGTGAGKIGWRDIEIISDENDAPCVKLYGRAKDRAEELGITGVALSLSHCEKYAIATSIGNV